eukprot:6479858-Amphidinium_carterae.1
MRRNRSLTVAPFWVEHEGIDSMRLAWRSLWLVIVCAQSVLATQRLVSSTCVVQANVMVVHAWDGNAEDTLCKHVCCERSLLPQDFKS